MNLSVYLKPEGSGFRERFLRIVKWIRRVCPDHQVRLFCHPPDVSHLGELEDVKVIPAVFDSPPEGSTFPRALIDKDPDNYPTLLLWGPAPVDGAVEHLFEGIPLAEAFCTHLRVHGLTGEEEGSVLTLIHGDPNPREPRLGSALVGTGNEVFTGFVTAACEERNEIFPIHTRGAEVTANLVRNVLAGRPVSSQAFLYPLIAMIEPTRRCNLACPMCPVGTGRLQQTPDMPFDRYRGLIDELGPFLIQLFLHNYGEPFLHPRIYEMIGYAKRGGIPDVEISTNGHLLDPSRLVESGLDEIKISIDGITQDTYTRYRRRGRLDKVIENVRCVVREKERRGTAKPLVELQFIIMKHNQHEMEGFRTLAAELGAERIRFKTFNLHMSGPEGCQVGVEFLPTHSEYTRYQDTGGRLLKQDLWENRCKWPWEWVVLGCDGRVVPCCNDFDGRYAMGNVFEDSFRSIWFGSPYDRLRQRILRRWREIPLCARCPVPSLSDLSFERVENTRIGV